MKGVDTPYSIVNHAHELVSAGCGFVIRYISPDTETFPNKRLSEAEVNALHSVALKIGCVWETGNGADLFTAANGQAHAKAATSVSRNLGQPTGSAIYFAVDLDVEESVLHAGVTDYFRAVKPAMATGGFKIGVYGSGRVCGYLKHLGLVEFTWLSQSTGWSGSSTYTDWNIKQGKSSTVAGLDCDLDESIEDAGLW